MSIEQMRRHFSFFKKTSHVYLDSAATSHKPSQVIKAMVDFYTHDNANVHRGVHGMGETATELYEDAREKVRSFINASSSSEIIFTSGTTEGINFVSDTWGRAQIKKDDEIVITIAEHHSNFLPWQRLANETGSTLKVISINKKTFQLDADFEKCITQKTKLIAVTMDSNVLGPIWQNGIADIKKLINRAHEVGAKVLLDAAQFVAHDKLDVRDLNADFVVFSAHKMCGPTGIGVLYIKKELHDEVPPYRVGGSMVYSASLDGSTWDVSPHKFEAGTPPIAQAIGLGAAIDFLNKLSYEDLKKHESSLCKRFIEGLEKIDGVGIIGNKERICKEGHLVSFTIDGIHPHDMASLLGERGTMLRAGHHCTQPLHNSLGIDSSLRASLYLYNTQEDIDRAVTEIELVVKNIRGK
jgi:cysteine desulfurase/selenocysteine lyase